MRVREIMTTNVFTVRTADPMEAAAKIMWEHDVGCVPVLAEDQDLIAGVITDRDLLLATYLDGVTLKDHAVLRAMTSDVLTCKPDDTLEIAAALMKQAQVHHLLVADGGRLLGIVSLNDLARSAVRADLGDDFARELVATIAAIHTPAAHVPPGQPRKVAAPLPPIPRAVDDTARW